VFEEARMTSVGFAYASASGLLVPAQRTDFTIVLDPSNSPIDLLTKPVSAASHRMGDAPEPVVYEEVNLRSLYRETRLSPVAKRMRVRRGLVAVYGFQPGLVVRVANQFAITPRASAQHEAFMAARTPQAALCAMSANDSVLAGSPEKKGRVGDPVDCRRCGYPNDIDYYDPPMDCQNPLPPRHLLEL
jgi:hypothetical protein